MATKKKAKKPKPSPQAKKAARPPQKAAKASKPKKAAAPPQHQPAKAAQTPRTAGGPPMARRSTTPLSQALSSGLSRSSQTLSGGSPTNGGIRYLTVQDLVDLHRAVSLEFGGTQAHPGVVESQFGLVNAVQRPQVTTLGREAYPSFPDKVAAFLFALLTNSPFRGGNRRVALASLFAFCELNNKTIDGRVFDEKTAETLFKRAAGYRELGIAPENVFREIREILSRAIVTLQ
jgi:prophage maintenance system killer protein